MWTDGSQPTLLASFLTSSTTRASNHMNIQDLQRSQGGALWGWKDPMIHEIERSAPTPLTSSMYLFLQLCSSRKWTARAKDAKTAFLQSRPTTRRRKLACRMPKDETFPGYDWRQLILLLTEVYGLVSGPAWWRRSFLELCVQELKYRVNVYDRCVLTLDGP